MDLVNLMYRYINKFINSDELLEELAKINLENYSKDEREKIKTLINDIKNIKINVLNEVDEYEKKRLETVNNLIEKFNTVNNKDVSVDEDVKELLNKQLKQLQEDKKMVRDGGKLYEGIFRLLTNHELVRKYALSMNDEELLDFITEYISVPFPPEIEQSDFDALVKVGIDKDKREELWRLAFNYYHKHMDFTKIVDYFILKRDSYYLMELIYAVELSLDIDYIVDKVFAMHDDKFIKELIDMEKDYRILSDEKKNEIKEKYNL